MCIISCEVSGFGQEVTAYYTNWSIYHSTYPLHAKDIPVDLVDTIIYAFVNVDASGNIQLSDPESDINKGNLEAFAALKEQALQKGKKLTTLFSVGGWGKGSDPFAKLSASQESRNRFASQAVEFCKKYDFDGMDVDWEFPKDKKEGINFFLLLLDLFQEFKKTDPDLLLTAAVPGLPAHYDKIPWIQIAPLLDRVHVMTYDLHGPWMDPDNAFTNYQNALGTPILGDPHRNVKSVMDFYASHFSKDILYVGIPLFFNTYADANEGIPHSHYGSPYSGPAPNPSEPSVKGSLLYKEVMRDLKYNKALDFWDKYSVAYSVYYPQNQVFGSGVNDLYLKKIANYTRTAGFRGVMIWELKGDTNDWNALRILNKELGN